MSNRGKSGSVKRNWKNALARSLSPPNNRGRANASWKVLSVEDDENLKQEVLALHVPPETDEWMIKEMSYLSQFTRIFPLEPKKDKDGAIIPSANEEVAEEEEDANEEDDDNNRDGAVAAAVVDSQGGNASGTASKKPKVKPATYDDILYHVFLHDKKQTMRFRCPIGNGPHNRDRLETSSLPPLGAASNSSTSTNKGMVTGVNSSSSSQKKEGGAAYMKAKELVKVPTRTQVDAASRLSQGLSVATLNPSVYRTNSTRALPSAPTHVVLDEDSSYSGDPYGIGGYDIFPGYHNGGSVVSMGGGLTSANMYGAQGSNRANKMVEDGRLSRLRLEMNRPTPASVLRQQVFRFDDNNGGGNGSAMHTAIGSNPLIYGGDSSALHHVPMPDVHGQVNNKYAAAVGAAKQMSYISGGNGQPVVAPLHGNGRNLNKLSAEQMFPEWF